LLYNLQQIVRNEGIKGFYRGYAIGLGIFIPYNAIWWSMYENTKKMSTVAEFSPPLQAAICSTAAVVVSGSVMHPLDLVKTRYQVATSGTVNAVAHTVAGAGRALDQKGLMQIVRNVLTESGKMGFYKGFLPRLCYGVPSSLIMMSVFEYIKPDDTSRDKDNALDVEFVA